MPHALPIHKRKLNNLHKPKESKKDGERYEIDRQRDGGTS